MSLKRSLLCGAVLPLLTAPMLISAAELPAFDRVRILQSAPSISDAELTDVDGEPFRLSELNGRVALIFFGFTNCPDVCPMAMTKMMELQRSGRIDKSRVAIVMISVDGERDTPDVMKTFLGNFSEDFIGLTGDPQAIKPIAREFKAAFFKGGPTAAGNGYQVSHSPQVFVLDPRGRLRAEMYNASVDAMAGLTDALLAEHAETSKTVR